MIDRLVRAARSLSKWQWLAIAIGAVVIGVFVDHWWPLYGGPVRGIVIDATTSRPLPDAIVVVKWRGHLGGVHGPRYPCYHVALARSDGEGKFIVPSWFYDVITGKGPEWLVSVDAHRTDKPIEYIAYKPGYFIPQQPYPVGPRDDIVVRMQPFVGTTLQRLTYLSDFTDQPIMCEADDKTLIPIYDAVYQEAKSTAASPQELELTDSLLTGLEAAEFGNTVALDRKGQRRVQRLREKESEQPK